MARALRKALRIGIIQKGRIVEERLVRERAPVTIGAAPKNTFSVPQSDLPDTFTLFPIERGEFVLAFDDRMDGRIQGPAGHADFGALVSQRLARRKGAVHLLALREDQWGKVLLGEVTVLFQFVTPPPEPPRPSLPPAARGNRFRSMDRLFVLLLAGSLALHVSAYVGLSGVEVREEVTLEEIPDRFARLLIPERQPQAPAKKEEKKEEKLPEVVERKVEEKKVEGPKEGPAEDQGAASARKAARAAAVAKAVQSKGILRVLGALGPGAGGGRGAVADVFGHGAGIGDVASALSGAGGVAVATDPGVLSGRKGGGTGGPARIGDLATGGGGGGKVALGVKSEVQVTGSVAAEEADIDSPDVDQAKLGQFVRARMGAIKACYENQLKRNPGLRGKIRIRFTILETGGLSEVTAADDGVGSAEVAACIVGTVRSWRTPFRPSAPVTVEYPFVFSAS